MIVSNAALYQRAIGYTVEVEKVFANGLVSAPPSPSTSRQM
jgi:hypothetical protein